MHHTMGISRRATSSTTKTVFFWVSTIFLFGLITTSTLVASETATIPTDPKNVHAVLVSSSRYWHNYRHANNAFAMYKRLRDNGVPRSNIVLMVGDEIPGNARNPFKNQMFAEGIDTPSLYDESVSITYRGSDVTVPNFLSALLGTVGALSPRRMLHTNQDSHILVYVTGHGGDNFFKFQDAEELTSQDLANVFEQMHLRKRYKQILFVADTCQAFTLADKLKTPNVYALGTSLKDQNAYAHHSDKDVGLSVIERWTYRMLQHYEKFATSSSTLQEIMVDPLQGKLGADIGVRDDLGSRPFNKVLIEEFLGPKDARKQRSSRTILGRSEWIPISASEFFDEQQNSNTPQPKRGKGSLVQVQRQIAERFASYKKAKVLSPPSPTHEAPDNFYQLVLGLLGAAFVLGKVSQRRPSR